MSDPSCRTFRESLGIYVVGAIEPSERAAVDAHLSQCPECREELAVGRGGQARGGGHIASIYKFAMFPKAYLAESAIRSSIRCTRGAEAPRCATK